MKDQLKQLDRLTKQNSQDGPAKDLQKAMAQGNLEKAREEVERLSKKLRDNELNAKDKDQLARQLEQMKEKVEELNRQQKAKEEELKQLVKEAKESGRDAEALERELKDLQKQGEKLKDLQDLAKQMEACKQCMQNGDAEGAADQLQQAANKLKELGASDKELQDVQERLQRMRDARESMCKGCQGKNPGDGPGGEGIGSGKRPDGKEEPYKSYDDKAKADFDPKGQIRIDNYVPGQAFKKPTRLEIEGEIQRASQDAPEAIERQRIPKAARDMARDYFRGLGGQGDK
jgi:DNA repair exonuclease SbcCD ATPase subunit